jgi:hypothetical protein|tara:strand:- start:986 stop:1393 length:408 start_codon:yes stop_codon:yes gene_type:complete
MIRLFVLILIYCIATTGGFFAFDYLGFPITVSLIIVFITLSYLGIYLREGLNSALAYWGLVYGAFSIFFLGIGLIQSHAGCLSLIGDCYQPRLPAGLFQFKMIVGFFLICTNGLAILAILNNMRILFLSSHNNHE